MLTDTIRPGRFIRFLGVRMAQTASEGSSLISFINAVLQNYCEKIGVADAKCLQFKARLVNCEQTLSTAINASDIIGIGAAVLCLKELRDDVNKALDALTPPPPQQPPPGPIIVAPPTPSWVLPVVIGASVLTIGGILFAIFR